MTGSVLKGPLTDNQGSFFGVTRGGGKYSSGIFFKYNPNQNTFAKLFDFPLRKNSYSGGTPSSLIVVKK